MNKSPKNTGPQKPGIAKKFQAIVTDHILHHLAFDNSFQANIITIAGNGQIVIVNNAACKLLGYSRKELLTKSRSVIFDINESGFKKMLKQRTAEGHSKGLVSAIKKSGKLIRCEITSAIFTDEDGIEKAITSIADMSQHFLEQKKIDTQKEKIVADNITLAKSRQKGIDIKKGEEVAGNIALARTKQKGIDTRKKKTVADNIVLAKSKQKKIDIKKEKIVAENILLALTKSDREKLLQEITSKAEYAESFKLVFNSSSDVLFDSDLTTNKVIISDAYEKEFGYKVVGNMELADDWFSHIHPDDREAVTRDYSRMLASADIEWKYNYRFLRADDSVANVSSSRIILRDTEGKAYRMIGYMHDISKQKRLEERLEQEIQLKEKQIADATEDAKETERSDIGKELHDNVNQLLGASRMYLDMAKRGGNDSQMYLARSSEYTLTAIEEIRKLTRGLATDIIKNLGLCVAIDKVTRDTMETNPVKISCAMERFEEYGVNDRFKLNIFRIVQEQLNNILKHARATKIAIRLLQNKKEVRLTIADNGVGFDISKKRKGIGVTNIKSRAASYNGTADFVSQPGQGCVLNVMFPLTAMCIRE